MATRKVRRDRMPQCIWVPMNENPTGVRPETFALDTLIKQTIERSNSRSTSRLFIDNRHALFPEMVIQDPVLEPIDKLVWMAIRLQAHEAAGVTTFPDYKTIGKAVNVSSPATISRALTILRLTRWLTLCSKYCVASRRSHTNVYALHDEALPFADVSYLDSGFQQFLRESSEHYHGRVKAIARGLLEDVDEGIEPNCSVIIKEKPVKSSEGKSATVVEKVQTRYLSYSGKFMNELRSHSSDKNCHGHATQKMKVGKSSVQNMKTATRKERDSHPQNLKTVRKRDRSLIYPRRLSERHLHVVDRHLCSVPASQRQDLLDEMEGRIRAEELGMEPLFDELNYLKTLCKALNKGKFELNLGIKVQEERKARKRAKDKKIVEQVDQTDNQKLEELRKEIRAGRGPLADIRKMLRMPNASRN